MQPTATSDNWLALIDGSLSVDEAMQWATRPGCGAVVTFAGTVRDHADGRSDVVALKYEAYDERVVPRLQAIADEARRKWPVIGRIALLHRTGELTVSEVSVLVAVSTPHRPEAFDAARFCIDTLKATVPIWKRELWQGGAGELQAAWATGSADISEVDGAGQ